MDLPNEGLHIITYYMSLSTLTFFHLVNRTAAAISTEYIPPHIEYPIGRIAPNNAAIGESDEKDSYFTIGKVFH